MNHLIRMIRVARRAENGFGNAAAIDFNCGRVFAHVTLEEGLAHFWDKRRQADDHAAYGDELVNIWNIIIYFLY